MLSKGYRCYPHNKTMKMNPNIIVGHACRITELISSKNSEDSKQYNVSREVWVHYNFCDSIAVRWYQNKRILKVQRNQEAKEVNTSQKYSCANKLKRHSLFKMRFVQLLIVLQFSS